MANRFNAGEVVVITARFYPLDIDGNPLALANPSTTPTIAITDPAGTVIQPETAMTQDSTGKWYFNFATASSYVLGVYKCLIKCIDATLTTEQRYTFNLGR